MRLTFPRTTFAALGLFGAVVACSDNPNLPQTGGSTGKLVLLNALASGAAPTLKVDGNAVALPAVGTSATTVLDVGAHQFQVLNGSQLLTSKTITIDANGHRTAVLSGSMLQALLLVNTIDTAVVPMTDAAKVRLVHTVPDAPSTDAYLFLTSQAADSGTRFVVPFTYGVGTDPNFPGFGVRPPGQYLVWLKASGTNTVLVQGGPFTLAAGDVYSFVLARNDAGALEIRSVKEH